MKNMYRFVIRRFDDSDDNLVIYMSQNEAIKLIEKLQYELSPLQPQKSIVFDLYGILNDITNEKGNAILDMVVDGN